MPVSTNAIDNTNIGAQFKNIWDADLANAIRVEAILQGGDGNGAIKNPKSDGPAAVQPFIKNAPGSMVGSYFASPVIVRQGSKRTFMGENAGYQDLSTTGAEPLVVQAQVYTSSLALLQRISDDAIERGRGDPASFMDTLVLAGSDLQRATQQAIEMSALWGRDSYGLLAAVPQGSGTTYDVKIAAAEWIPAYWATQEGAAFQFFNGTTARTGAGSVAVIGTVADGGVDFEADDDGFYTVTFELNVGSPSFTTGDRIFPYTAIVSGAYKEMVGLSLQFSAQSGTYFDIDRADYSLMQGNTYDLEGAQLLKETVPLIANTLINRGNSQKKTLLVSPAGWATLDIEEMQIQRRDVSYSPDKAQSGVTDNGIQIANLRGNVQVICHPYMKQGKAFMFTPEQVRWVKAREQGWKKATGASGGESYAVPGTSGVEMQYRANQAILARLPAQATLIDNVGV